MILTLGDVCNLQSPFFICELHLLSKGKGGEKKRSPDRTNPKQIKFCLISTVIHFWHSAPFIHEKWKN